MATIDVVRTYLEMRSPAELRPVAEWPEGATLAEVQNCPVHFFRYLYAEVGRQYQWKDRLAWSDEAVRRYLAGPVRLWVLYVEGAPAGYFELSRHGDGSVEIAYFGLMPEYQGAGLGKALLSRAIQTAWSLTPSRVWLHTCTLDHPAALPNYLKRGFKEVRRETYQAMVGD